MYGRGGNSSIVDQWLIVFGALRVPGAFPLTAESSLFKSRLEHSPSAALRRWIIWDMVI
jgi:hypothetical protein